MPKGFSDYQACWVVESDSEGEDRDAMKEEEEDAEDMQERLAIQQLVQSKAEEVGGNDEMKVHVHRFLCSCVFPSSCIQRYSLLHANCLFP